jgi:hypothetical protein
MTQKLFKKVLEFERNFISISWEPIEGKEVKDVYVIGSFTNPPWEKKVELDYCPLRGIFVKYMSNLNEGTYLIKFVVDGEYKCNPNFTTITDAQGHFNNIIKIEYEYSDQPANS